MSEILVELQEFMGGDRSVANAAWTSSFDKAKRDARSDADVERLVNQLADQRHSTPFESVVFRFWYKWPIFVDREHMTHRIASHNGQSARYRTIPTDWYDVPQDVRDIADKVWNGFGDECFYTYASVCEAAFEFYNEKLTQAKAAESSGLITNDEYKRFRDIIRGVLPVASMVERTSIFNLRSFANYQKLRNTGFAQKEIAFAAQRMLEEVRKANVCPIALAALERNGWDI